MKKELNVDWILKLEELKPNWTDFEEATHKKTDRLADYIKSESGGTFYLDKYSGYIVQKKDLPWSYLFDIIKNAPKFGFIVAIAVPPRFRINSPKPERGTMYAYYNSENDAIRVRIYTGGRREDLAGYDGYGREPDELEVIEGLRDKEGNWVEELSLKWI